MNANVITPIAYGAGKFNGYTIDDDFEQILRGKVELPNFEEMPLQQGLANIAAGGGMIARPDVDYAKVPGDTAGGRWARYFLSRTQAGTFDGTGYVIFYDTFEARGSGRIARFAICRHDHVSLPGANPSRGWHPSYCGKCGLNTTVDSGD